MSTNRIQKLLFSEYSDFEDMVLVESPFAETSRDGRGIRQVQIGLTPTKLVLATDIIKRASECSVFFFPGRIDPEIESLELISIFPIELVTLSVFRRRRRRVLKAKFHDGNPNHSAKVVYFELGGSDKRKMFWNLWCERIRFLSPEDRGGSSLTETSVGSSTSNSSIFVTRSRVFEEQIWQYYERGDVKMKFPKWTEKDLFFGDKLEQVNHTLQPISLSLLLENDTDEIRTLYRRRAFFNCKSSTSSHLSKETPNSTNRKAEHINRFGEGIEEGCNTGLYLPAISYSKCGLSVQSLDSLTMLPKIRENWKDFKTFCEDGVIVWETKKIKNKIKHPRRYGLCTFPDFYRGVGIYHINIGDSNLLKLKRTFSNTIIKGRSGAEFKLDKEICNSCSYESLHPWINTGYTDKLNKDSRFLYFWTTDFWFCPKPLRTIYRRTQSYLKGLNRFLKEKHAKLESRGFSLKHSKRSRKTFGAKLNQRLEKIKTSELSEMKKFLTFNHESTIWDFDSSTLAFQLTMIDSFLFLQITITELRLLTERNSAENAVNFMAWLVFSHRCSCLIATEILKVTEIKARSRLITRFINTAEKCHRLHNFQSCRTVITGLQSPSIFRLKETWKNVRQHHATKYQMFEKLCRLYRDPRLLCYQKSFYRASQEPPFLPSASHLISILFGQSENFSVKSLKVKSQEFKTEDNQKEIFLNAKDDFKQSLPKLVKQFLSAFRIYNSSDKSANSTDLDTSSSDSQGIIIRIEGDSQKDIVGSLKYFFEPLSNETVNHLFECEELLKMSQSAAGKYDLTENALAKEFLLKAPYNEHFTNFLTSLRIEHYTE